VSVTITRQQQIGARTWIFEWESTLENPTYYIYRDGLLMAVTRAERRQFEVGLGEYVQIEILDDPDAVPGRVYPGRLLLGWQRAENASAYRVEEFSGGPGGTWQMRKRIVESGRAYYTYRTRFLEDLGQFQWRVVSERPGGGDGGILPFSAWMVRRPDTPELEWSYDPETRKITFSA